VSYALLAVRWLLALTLLGAGVSKVGSPSAFENSVSRYALVPARYTGVVARAVIAAELLLAVGLGLGLILPLCGVAGAVLFTAFAVAVGWNLGHGRSFDCGCSADERPISWRLAATDMVLAGLGILVAFGPSGALAVWGASHGGAGLSATWAIPVPLGVIIALGLWRLAQQSRWLWPQRPLPREEVVDVSLDVIHVKNVAGSTASSRS
jgi:uncharacterized membrane protein YphA (DoxX/SURF4 family)